MGGSEAFVDAFRAAYLGAAAVALLAGVIVIRMRRPPLSQRERTGVREKP